MLHEKLIIKRHHPPTPAELAESVAVATRYGYDLGTPEQNAAIGITLSF
jgi:hypothetical protein